ncbi:MAG: hypothetical protein HOV92_18200 [Streptomyces sp.]|nr:hypothetical protein [Streptomyces sp.]
MHRYRVFNAPMATTAATAAVATGTTIKTMLQLATPSTRQIQLISWGYSFSEAPGGVGTIELIQTDVAATVTAHVASGIQSLDPNAPTSLLTLGTAATGYTATAEGTTTASRVFDAVRLPASVTGSGTPYVYQWLPDERPIIAVSKFLRVRATTPTSGVNLLTWICFDE